MNGKHFIGKNAKQITIGSSLPPVSKITLKGKDNKIFTAGDDTGYNLTISVPTATQAMANNLISQARGFVYRGYKASGTFISPEAELGDGITVDGIYSVLGHREFKFTPKMSEDIAAPYNNETNHESQYTGTYERRLKNKIDQNTNYGGTTISKDTGISIQDSLGNLSLYQGLNGQLMLSQYANIEGALSSSTTMQGLTGELQDAQGNISSLQRTASSLSSQISDAQGNISILQQTATSLSSQISDAQGNISILQQTSTRLSSQIISAEGDISSLEQTATKLSSQIISAQGDISSLEQTATSLSSQIVSAKGDISSLQQTANSLTSTISSMEGDISSVEQYAKSITLSVTNSSESSTITLKAGSTQISSQKIEFTGMVTFSDLSGSNTTINGANIKTGKISADRIDASELKIEKVVHGSGSNYDVMLAYNYGSGTTLGWSLAKTTIQGTTIQIRGDKILIGYLSSEPIGFFGSSGSSRKSVSTVSTSSSVEASTVATGLNNLINALKSYGLIS